VRRKKLSKEKRKQRYRAKLQKGIEEWLGHVRKEKEKKQNGKHKEREREKWTSSERRKQVDTPYVIRAVMLSADICI
jgi:hypothetical protein